jgi:hypothetical protein
MSILTEPKIPKVDGDPSAGDCYLVAGFNPQIYTFSVPADDPSNKFRHVRMSAPPYSARLFPIRGISTFDAKSVLAVLFTTFERSFPDGVAPVLDETGIFKSVAFRFYNTSYVPGVGYQEASVSPQPALYALMAAIQFGERTNMLDYLIWTLNTNIPGDDVNAKFLTEMPEVIKWKYQDTQLPSEVSCVLEKANAGHVYTIEDSELASLPLDNSAVTGYKMKRIDAHFLSDGQIFAQWTDGIDTFRVSEIKRVVTRIVNYNPFFVRWVNRLGGVDSWCFFKKQKQMYGVGEVVTTQRLNPDNVSLERRSIVVNKSGTFGIVAGANNVTAQDWDALVWLIYSPIVQYYDIDTATWINVTVDSKGQTFETDNPVGKFEATFVFDELTTQY